MDRGLLHPEARTAVPFELRRLRLAITTEYEALRALLVDRRDIEARVIAAQARSCARILLQFALAVRRAEKPASARPVLVPLRGVGSQPAAPGPSPRRTGRRQQSSHGEGSARSRSPADRRSGCSRRASPAATGAAPAPLPEADPVLFPGVVRLVVPLRGVCSQPRSRLDRSGNLHPGLGPGSSRGMSI
jgi:hypothetical protein